MEDKYKLASIKNHPKKTLIRLGRTVVGGDKKIIISGPCSVEKNMVEIAQALKKAGADMIRAGAYKPRTSPYDPQGMGLSGLKLLEKSKQKTGLPIVTEATGIYRVESDGKLEKVLENVIKYADIIQVGARNAQSFDFLSTIGKMTSKTKKPILLKRGLSQTTDEFLLSAEYIMRQGNKNIILCLRGVAPKTKETRNTIDIEDIKILKKKTHLPIIFDPSHASGRRDMVEELSRKALDYGADGLLIEAHTEPDKAISDAYQTIDMKTLKRIIEFAHNH